MEFVRRLSFLVLSLCLALPIWGAPARLSPFLIKQPDGTVFQAVLSGDERGNRLSTLQGNPIQKEKDGFFVYLTRSNGKWKKSKSRPGRDTPPALTTATPLTQLQRFPRRKAKSMTGNQPLLALVVSFSDRSATYTATDWSTTLFGSTQSVKAYYLENSLQQLTLDPAAESCGTANDGIAEVTLTYPHPDPSGSVDAQNQQISRDALLAADSCIDFSSFDSDHDSFISSDELHILVIVAGFEASYFPDSPSIWAHQWCLLGSVSPPTLDQVQVAGCLKGGYVQVGETHHDHQAALGIIAHELGHDMGLEDLYDTDGSSFGVGDWSIMGTGNWLGATYPGDTPSQFDPFSKALLGWIVPQQINEPASQISLSPVETSSLPSGGVLQLKDNPNGFEIGGTGEYFLLEYRKKVGFDVSLPGAGLLIWHVDETQTGNSNEQHKLLDLEEADGQAQLDASTSLGDSGDPFPGSANITTFSSTTNPNSLFYDGSSSGAEVNSISLSTTITLNVIVPDKQAPASPTLLSPSDSAQVTATQPTFDWSDSTDPSGVSYTLQIDDQDTFATPVIEENVSVSTFTLLSPLSVGTYYWRVRAEDGAGNIGNYSSAFLLSIIHSSDTTPPLPPAAIRDGTDSDLSFQSSTTALSANYDATNDAESGILRYWVSIGTAAGQTDILDWTDNALNLTFSKSGLSLAHNQTYYINVKAENGASLMSSVVSSNGITIDTTAPQAITVIDGLTSDLQTQSDGTSLSAKWTASSDPESGISRYWVSFGTTPGATDLLDWTDVGTQTSTTASILTLSDGVTYYANVKAENGASSTSVVASSDGVLFQFSPPTSVGSLQALAQKGSIALSWSAATAGSFPIQNYHISRSTTQGGPYTEIASVAASTLSYTDTTVSDRVTTYYIVQTEDNSGQYSASSTEVKAFSFSPLDQGFSKSQADLQNTNRSLQVGPLSLLPKWTAPAPAGSFASANRFDQIFLASSTGELKLYQSDGTLLYTYSAGSPPAAPPLILESGGVFLRTQDGCLQAVDSQGNKLYASCGLSGYFTINPTGDKLYLAKSNALSILNADGTTDQTLTLSTTITSPLALSPTGNTLYGITSSGDLLGIDLLNRTLLFSLSLLSPTSFTDLAVLASGSIAVVLDSTLYIVSTSGTILAQTPLGGTALGMALASDDSVLIATASAALLHLSDTGALLASLSLSSVPSAFVLDKNDIAFLSFQDGNIQSYDLQFTPKLSYSDPSFSFTAPLFLTYDGNLAAFSNSQFHFFRATNLAPPSFVYDKSNPDADFQAATDSLTGVWSSVTDAASYEVAIGTSTTIPDFLFWTDVGNVTTTTLTGITLKDGSTYYLFVRGVSATGALGEQAISDGITVDTTSPTQPVVLDGGEATNSSTSLTYQISAEDKESGIQDYLVGVGTSTSVADVLDFTSVSGQATGNVTGLSLTSGKTYYLLAKAVNQAGGTSSIGVSDGILVDTQSPALTAQQITTTDTTASLLFTLSEPATLTLTYGTSSSNLSESVTAPSLIRQHTLNLSNLTASTLYYYKLTLTDALGNSASTSVQTFTTEDSLAASLKKGLAFLALPEKQSKSILDIYALPSDTQVAFWDIDAQQFVVSSSGTDPTKLYPDAGRAFLISLSQDTQISASSPAQSSAQIALSPGWNFIGQPLTTSLDITLLTATCNGETLSLSDAALKGSLSPYAWGYDNTLSSYVLIFPVVGGGQTTALKPGQGYFIFAAQACQLTFQKSRASRVFQGKSSQGTSTPLMTFSVRASGYADLQNYIFREKTTILEPPSQKVQLYFSRGKTKYAALPYEDQPIFFTVRSPKGSPVDLSWKVNEAYQGTLIDLQNNVSIDLAQGKYRYHPKSSEQLFRLSLSPKPSSVASLSVEQFYLYPNPVSRHLPSIRYRYKGRLDRIVVEIFTTQGRKMFRMESTPKGEVPLPKALKLPNGVYFYRLRFYSGDQVENKVGKFVVLR